MCSLLIPAGVGGTDISQGWGWWRGGPFRFSVFEAGGQFWWGKLTLRNMGVMEKIWAQRNLSLLISHQFWNAGGLWAMSKHSFQVQHPRKTSRSPELPLSEYVNILCQEWELARKQELHELWDLGISLPRPFNLVFDSFERERKCTPA